MNVYDMIYMSMGYGSKNRIKRYIWNYQKHPIGKGTKWSKGTNEQKLWSPNSTKTVGPTVGHFFWPQNTFKERRPPSQNKTSWGATEVGLRCQGKGLTGHRPNGAGAFKASCCCGFLSGSGSFGKVGRAWVVFVFQETPEPREPVW